MNTLYAKLALLLAAAFVAIGAALLVATHPRFAPASVLELSADVMIGGVAFAMLVAVAVFQLFTRRLRRLAEAVEAFQAAGFATPLRVPCADAAGDEIDRLAAHVETMSERITSQIADLEQVAWRRRELLANVSHDLRTPLASMQGYLELLLLRHGQLDPAEERNYLETAVRHGERLGRLVRDLLELSKLEADEVPMQPEPFALGELAQDVAQKFALDATRRRVRLSAACAAPAPWVRADIAMVERVLENLVGNALRHTPAGGTVTIEVGDERSGRASLAVRDTGEGIPAAELPGLFERYERASRSRPGARRGLGLAIARRIVRLHGGELAVHSRVGHGSRFAFDLPLAPR